MKSIAEIINEMAETNAVIKTAQNFHNSPVPISILPPEIEQKLAKYSGKIEPLPYYFSAYMPSEYPAAVEGLGGDMTRLFGGASLINNAVKGLWESESNDIVADNITLVKSSTNVSGMIAYFDQLINRIIFWGNQCQQEAMALEIGNLSGSLLLLIYLK